MRNNKEHQEQVALIDWCKFHEGKYPELKMLYAVPNGGHRHVATAIKLKREGVRAGVPDLCLPVARGGSHGLYVEMKCLPNKPTKEQAVWIENLREQGYMSIVCYDWITASEALKAYLGLGKARPYPCATKGNVNLGA